MQKLKLELRQKQETSIWIYFCSKNVFSKTHSKYNKLLNAMFSNCKTIDKTNKYQNCTNLDLFWKRHHVTYILAKQMKSFSNWTTWGFVQMHTTSRQTLRPRRKKNKKRHVQDDGSTWSNQVIAKLVNPLNANWYQVLSENNTTRTNCAHKSQI